MLIPRFWLLAGSRLISLLVVSTCQVPPCSAAAVLPPLGADLSLALQAAAASTNAAATATARVRCFIMSSQEVGGSGK